MPSISGIGAEFLSRSAGIVAARHGSHSRDTCDFLPAASEHRKTLGSLTRTFELVWYGTHEADANAFSETLAQLEKLGCQSN